MKKLVLLIAILMLMIPAIAQDSGRVCSLEAPDSEVTVNFMGWAFPITEFFAEELELCNEVDNLIVNTQLLDSNSADEQTRIALAGDGDSPWAILHTTPPRISELNSLSESDVLMPLNDLVEQYREEYDLDDIPQTAWDSVTFDGNIYGVPFMSNTLHMFYRTDLFEQYELEVPTNYDEVIAACEVLSEEDSIDIPFTMNLHAGWAWDIEFLHFIRSFGGTYLNEDNTPAFNSPEGVAGLTKMKEVVDACMGQEGLTYSIDDSEIGMETGSLAFVNIWASRANNMDDPDLSDFVGIIGFAPAAAPNPDGGLLGGSAYIDAYAIPMNTDVDPDLAFRIIMETFDVESQIAGAEFGPVIRSSVSDAGVGGRNLEALAITVAEGVGAPSTHPAIALAGTALSNWLPLVGTGELTPQEALDNAAEEYLAEAIAQGFVTE